MSAITLGLSRKRSHASYYKRTKNQTKKLTIFLTAPEKKKRMYGHVKKIYSLIW